MGKAIKLVRIQREMSQADLANAAGISVSYLSLLERGKRDPAFSVVEQIACGLKIPLMILIFAASESQDISQMDRSLLGKLSLELLSSTSRAGGGK